MSNPIFFMCEGGYDCDCPKRLSEWRKITGRRKLPRHGTRNEYQRHGCRCILCKSAHAKYHREYAQRRKLERQG